NDWLKRVLRDNDSYLYEYQEPTNYQFEWFGSDPAFYSPRFFKPQTHANKPDPAPLVAMIRTMNTVSDADFASAMAPYIDLPRFMKYLAIEDFMAETDGVLTGMNNFYLYRDTKSISQFMPKDKDLSFGGSPTNPNRWQ